MMEHMLRRKLGHGLAVLTIAGATTFVMLAALVYLFAAFARH